MEIPKYGNLISPFSFQPNTKSLYPSSQTHTLRQGGLNQRGRSIIWWGDKTRVDRSRSVFSPHFPSTQTNKQTFLQPKHQKYPINTRKSKGKGYLRSGIKYLWVPVVLSSFSFKPIRNFIWSRPSEEGRSIIQATSYSHLILIHIFFSQRKAFHNFIIKSLDQSTMKILSLFLTNKSLSQFYYQVPGSVNYKNIGSVNYENIISCLFRYRLNRKKGPKINSYNLFDTKSLVDRFTQLFSKTILFSVTKNKKARTRVYHFNS